MIQYFLILTNSFFELINRLELSSIKVNLTRKDLSKVFDGILVEDASWLVHNINIMIVKPSCGLIADMD